AGLGMEFGASLSETFDNGRVDATGASGLTSDARDTRAEALIAGVDARGGRSVFLRWLKSLPAHPTAAAALAAISATLAWGPLSRKRISRLTAECFPWWLQLFGTLVGASADASRHAPTRFARR